MRRLAEAAAFLGLSAALHAAVWTQSASGTGQGAGAGGSQAVSVQPASAAMARMVETWERPPEVAEAPNMAVSPVTEPVFRPPSPETPVAEQLAMALPQAELPGATPRPLAASPSPVLEAFSPLPTLPELPGLTAITLPQMDSAPEAVAPLVMASQAAPVRTPAEPPVPAPLELAMAPQAELPLIPTAPVPLARPSVPELSTPDIAPAPQIESAPAPPPPSDLAIALSPRPQARPAQQPAAPVAGQRAAGTGQGQVQGHLGSASAASLSAGERQGLMATWAAQIHARIERRKPRVAGQGTVTLRIVVARDGALHSVAITRSSGNARLDRAGVSAVERAGRFPAAPEGLTEASFGFDVPIRFQ